MELNGNGKSFKITTFKHAFRGIWQAVVMEPNIKIHLGVALIVIILGFLFNISSNDWEKIVILIGMVISLELTNTAIEAVVDSLTSVEHPGAKLAKDVSAGAVLVAAITALVCGIIIFTPYFF